MYFSKVFDKSKTNDRRAAGRSASQTVEGVHKPRWFGSRLSWLVRSSGRPCCFAPPPFGGFAVSSKQEYSVVYDLGERFRSTLQYPTKFLSPIAIPLVSYWSLSSSFRFRVDPIQHLHSSGTFNTLTCGVSTHNPRHPLGVGLLRPNVHHDFTQLAIHISYDQGAPKIFDQFLRFGEKLR